MNKVSKAVLPISIVIPTYSEEVALPKLLKSIQGQLVGPAEIIVADANSPDKTREIAKSYGCVVVDGGKIAVGRNNGAKVAKSEYLLFMDADTCLMTPTTLLEAFTEFVKREADIASAGFKPDKEGSTTFGYATGVVMFNAWNALRNLQSISQSPAIEGGAFILMKQAVYKHIKGFDERMGMGEDRDVFVRAVKLGYKYLHLSQNVLTSTRRYDTPQKTANSIISGIGLFVLLGSGIYLGSQLAKKVYSKYGKGGGGAGRDLNE